MWLNLRTGYCQVDQQQSLEHFDRKAVFVSVGDILAVRFFDDSVYSQLMRQMFQMVEALQVVVDDKDVDTEDEQQHCSEDGEQVVEVV